MGADRAEKERRGLRRPRASAPSEGGADWGSVDPKVVLDAIQAAARKGGALRFGYTRDGGAYSIGVYSDGDYFTDYIRPSEDVEQYLSDLAAAFTEYEAPTPPPARARGARKA